MQQLRGYCLALGALLSVLALASLPFMRLQVHCYGPLLFRLLGDLHAAL